MRKRLLIGVAIINAIMFSISLAYASFRAGLTFENHHGTDFSYFLFPDVYFILFLISCGQVKWHSFSSGKLYYVIGFATLMFISVFWGNWLTYRLEDLPLGIPSTIVLDIIIYPAALFTLSLASCVFYIICAVIARKENQITFSDSAN